ncbi:putative DBF4-type domain-containing protein [Seiridium unicorne]|uniref:DBF4-type domain-containing protein n=1 Tax=Seiridium unicorne TaxID=138068 RepID=A0ABR2VHG4_9PEZI
MSTARRIPLSSNQNVANSPIRVSALAKPKRSYATQQREEAYAQPPPAKKQILDSGIPRPLKSPSQQQRVAKPQLSLQSRRNASTYESKLARERSGQHHRVESTSNSKYTERDLEEIRQWQSHHRARFPKMVFYFDNIPEDVRAKVVKQITSLGAREERFFSSDITHVVTTRSIPAEQRTSRRQEDADTEANHEQHQPQTINPSLLDRSAEQSVRRKLFPDAKPKSQVPTRAGLAQMQDTRPKRSTDVLSRAREMSKKIWSLDKLQRMLSMLLEPDLNVSAAIAYGSRNASEKPSHAQSKAADERLLQLLHNERVNGPSDRDLTVATKELHYFRGPYLYIYDFEEKQKPIMVREYNRVQEKSDGEWPQFRTAPLGRCPFVEDYDHREVVKPKKREVVKAAVGPKPVLQPPEVAPPKPVTGKRSLSEMESAHNRGSSVASTELFNPPKLVAGKKFEFRPNAFTSRAGPGRLFGGEPVASGVQPSNVTSAIRSQMISSTAATPGAIGVVSKEVHGLQRKVLQRNSSHDLSSRRTVGSVETSLKDENESKRSLGRTSSRKLDLIDEQAATNEDDDQQSAKARTLAEKRVVKPKKKDPKPGYCENCQDKFEDFDDHIASRKHRKFADNDDNWGELDDLLSQLSREPKHKSFPTWTPALPEYPVY